MTGPLNELRVIELAGIGPAPHAGMMLSDMGADVVRVDRLPTGRPADLDVPPKDVYLRGRRSIAVDLKTEAGVDVVLRLIADADVLIEGFRPGVIERLGLAPERLLALNPRLVIGRVTGWGQEGPNAALAGHDLNYIALAGALHGIGRPGTPPPPTANYIGDFGGGSMFLLFGVLCAVIEAQRSGRGQVVDAAMVDGVAALGAALYGQMAKGLWCTSRGTNLLDGSAPHYDSYKCSDEHYITIAPLEPQFYSVLRQCLQLDGPLWDNQDDRSLWGERKSALADLFASRTRAEWCQVFEGEDACFAPVLSLEEATEHPHLVARGTFVSIDEVVQPAPAPRFSRTAGEIRRPAPHVGEHTIEVLRDHGFVDDEIQTLTASGAIATAS
jgi:alpha-methylacyl-CoA racemase